MEKPRTSSRSTEEETRGWLKTYQENKWNRVWLTLPGDFPLLSFHHSNTASDDGAFLSLDISLADVKSVSKKDLELMEVPEDSMNPFPFKIEIFGVVHLLAAATANQRTEWLEIFQKLKELPASRYRKLTIDPGDSDIPQRGSVRQSSRPFREIGTSLKSKNDTLEIIIDPKSPQNKEKESFLTSVFNTLRPSSPAAVLPFGSIPESSNNFDYLPDEVMFRIWKLFEPTELGHLAQVCKRFKRLSYDIPLWQDIAFRNQWGFGPSSDPNHSEYVKRFLSFRRKQKEEAIKRQKELKELRKQQRKKQAGIFLLVAFFARPYEWVALLSLIWLTVVSALRLDNVIQWHWGLILIPAYFVVLQMLGGPIAFDALSSKFDHNFPDELDPDENHGCGPIFYFMLFVLPFYERNRFRRQGVYPLVGLFALFALFLFIRVGGISRLPFWAVFLPLELGLIWSCVLFAFAGNNIFRDKKRFDAIMPMIGLVLLTLFFIFLGLKIEDKIKWNWFIVFIPLFLIKAIMIVTPIVLSLLTVCLDRMNSYWIEDRSRWAGNVGSYCLSSLLVVILVLGPLLAFEVLLCQRLEGLRHTSFVLIFVPLFVLESLAICGCTFVNCAFWCS